MTAEGGGGTCRTREHRADDGHIFSPAAPPATHLAHRAGLPVLVWPALAVAGVDALVTTRHGGVSTGPYASLNLGLHVGDRPEAVVENRRRAAAAVGATLPELVFAQQVHGRHATVVGRDDRGRGTVDAADALPATDILVTDHPEPVLAVLVADCVPLVLVDPAAGVLAVVHAGWRGTAARTVDAALAQMAALGARAGRVVAGIGPAVSPAAYEVDEPVAAGLRGALGPAAGEVLRPVGASAPGRWLADLPAANRHLLVAAGVAPDAVHVATATTGGDGPFFSDRAQRPCGRMALLARRRVPGDRPAHP